jgi:hypothetical protein
MAPRLADHDSTTAFHNPIPLSSSEVATAGEEATYWPGLREIETRPDQQVDSETVGATGWSNLLESESHTNAWDNPRASSAAVSGAVPPVPEVTPLIRLRTQTAPARQFRVLQQWEGVVTRIDGDWFEADLRDLTAPNNPMEIAEFPFAEISPADKPLIRPGCVFYWVIGYETRSGGQITNTSEIRVRRAPQWTQRKLDELKARARELFTLESEDGAKAARPK